MRIGAGKTMPAADYLAQILHHKVTSSRGETPTTLVYRTDGEIVDAAFTLLRQRGFDGDECIEVVDGAPHFSARKTARQNQLSRFILENLEESDTLEKLDVPLDVATSSVELPSAQFVTPMIRTIGHQIANRFKVGFTRELT